MARSDAPTPKLEWKPALRITVWISLVVVFGVALYLLGSGITGAARSSDLDERGVEVPARVLDVSVDPGDDSGPSSELTVRFKGRGDERVLVTTDVTYDGDFDEDHPAGRRTGVRVEYDSQDASSARLVGESGDSQDRIVAGSVFTLLIPVLAIVYWRRPDLIGL